jgi:putative hydrolase of HD superfamily
MSALRSANPNNRLSPLMHAVLRHAEAPDVQVIPAAADVRADVDAIVESFQLQRIRRFYRQRHWQEESTAAEFSDKLESGLKLENVAAHSWHVADAAHLLTSHFPELDSGRVVRIALLHDKLEIYTGDYDPVGSDGQGSGTHAFNPLARADKQQAERIAAKTYLSRLRPAAREAQRDLIDDIIENRSAESRLVKACDKMQALAFVMEKKAGRISDEHLIFTLRYSRKALAEFPRIRFHYAELLGRFLNSVANFREVSRAELDQQLFAQLELPL